MIISLKISKYTLYQITQIFITKWKICMILNLTFLLISKPLFFKNILKFWIFVSWLFFISTQIYHYLSSTVIIINLTFITIFNPHVACTPSLTIMQQKKVLVEMHCIKHFWFHDWQISFPHPIHLSCQSYTTIWHCDLVSHSVSTGQCVMHVLCVKATIWDSVL